MRTVLPLGEAAPDSEGGSRPRWMVRAEATAARLSRAVAAPLRGADGGSLDVDVAEARASF